MKKVSTNEINDFIMLLNAANKLYVVKTITLSDRINELIEKSGINRKDFCEKFKIRSRDYRRFVAGAFNYTLLHMATVNAWFIEVEINELEKRVPVQITKSESK